MTWHQTGVSTTNLPPSWLCQLPSKDYWSTPFAESLFSQLDLPVGASVLDIACGDGIPAFCLAHRVGPTGRVVGIDLNEAQLIRARACQGPYFPWLEFRREDLRALSSDLERFDRITGNLAFMFFRPHRKEALQALTQFLKPGGQLVFTFPSLGTFDSLWQRVDQEMASRGYTTERKELAAYIAERPSAADARQWLLEIGLERVAVFEQPLQVETDAGNAFLYHPLLRGGFLEDVYDCFTEQELADSVMNAVAYDIHSFMPLIAQRCVMSGWHVKS
ncbi:MAG: methyltransferase domain-containing protein [Nitrospirales bacterium]|nr:methyltransferase domain-containing protein [Nitrospirales bacterium]